MTTSERCWRPASRWWWSCRQPSSSAATSSSCHSRGSRCRSSVMGGVRSWPTPWWWACCSPSATAAWSCPRRPAAAASGRRGSVCRERDAAHVAPARPEHRQGGEAVGQRPGRPRGPAHRPVRAARRAGDRPGVRADRRHAHVLAGRPCGRADGRLREPADPGRAADHPPGPDPGRPWDRAGEVRAPLERHDPAPVPARRVARAVARLPELALRDGGPGGGGGRRAGRPDRSLGGRPAPPQDAVPAVSAAGRDPRDRHAPAGRCRTPDGQPARGRRRDGPHHGPDPGHGEHPRIRSQLDLQPGHGAGRIQHPLRQPGIAAPRSRHAGPVRAGVRVQARDVDRGPRIRHDLGPDDVPRPAGGGEDRLPGGRLPRRRRPSPVHGHRRARLHAGARSLVQHLLRARRPGGRRPGRWSIGRRASGSAPRYPSSCPRRRAR